MANGKVYTWDNGPNVGWGGIPENPNGEDIVDDNGDGLPDNGPASNNPNESNSNGRGDQLHLVEAGVYAGHPNPIRAAGSDAGLYGDGSESPGLLDKGDDGFPDVSDAFAADPHNGTETQLPGGETMSWTFDLGANQPPPPGPVGDFYSGAGFDGFGVGVSGIMTDGSSSPKDLQEGSAIGDAGSVSGLHDGRRGQRRRHRRGQRNDGGRIRRERRGRHRPG